MFRLMTRKKGESGSTGKTRARGENGSATQSYTGTRPKPKSRATGSGPKPSDVRPPRKPKGTLKPKPKGRATGRKRVALKANGRRGPK